MASAAAYESRPNHGKWILRQVLYKYVPPQLIERPKMGFGIPLGDWLRGPLRHWAEALLNANELRQQGFFDALAIRKIWQEHLAGRGTWQYHLWDILMFQLWLQHQSGSAAVEPGIEAMQAAM